MQPGFWKKISKPFKDAAKWVKEHVVDPLVEGVEEGFSYVNWTFDELIDFTVPLLDTIWEETQQGLGAIVGVFHDEVDIRLRLKIENTDPQFPSGSLMVRAWGSDCAAGADPAMCENNRPIIVPRDAHMRVRQWGYGFLPVMFDDTIDGDGNVHLRALQGANGRGGDFCIELSSGYGMITTDFIPNEVCDFRNARYGNFERDVDDTLRINHSDIQVFSQLADTHAYNVNMIGVEPHRADILTGWVANNVTSLLNGGSRAMALCLDFPGVGGGVLTDIGAAADLLVGLPVMSISLSIIDKDIWWPDNTRHSVESRGVMTHEYGHFTMCDLLYNVEGPSGLTGLLARMGDGEESREDETGILTEAIADAYALQVVGGANYIQGSGASNGAVAFCQTSPCLEENFAGINDYSTSLYHDEMARYLSLINDMFDAPNAAGGRSDAFVNGDYWQGSATTTGLTSATASYLGTDDETVQLTPADWVKWVEAWLSRGVVPDVPNVIGGLFGAASQNHNWCQMCEVAAVHHPAASPAIHAAAGSTRTPALIVDRFNFCVAQADVLSLVGAAPSGPNQIDLSCNACPANSVVDPATGLCVACPSGQATDPVTGTCQVCATGTVPNSAGGCAACGVNEIASGGGCIACPVGFAANATSTACTACAADAVVDMTTYEGCDFFTIPAPPNAAAADNCPAEYWLDVQLGTGFFDEFIADPIISDATSQSACSGAQTSVDMYAPDASGNLTRLTGQTLTPVYNGGGCDGLVCPEVCELPAGGPALTQADAAAAGNAFRIRVRSQSGGTPIDTSLTLELTANNCIR